jgi:hypothetical protein
MTTHLLCPQNFRDEFDADMEGFCCRVQNGTLAITHNDWPSFLYPEDSYNLDALDEHLLQGSFLLSVCVFNLFDIHAKSSLSVFNISSPDCELVQRLHQARCWARNVSRI